MCRPSSRSSNYQEASRRKRTIAGVYRFLGEIRKNLSFTSFPKFKSLINACFSIFSAILRRKGIWQKMETCHLVKQIRNRVAPVKIFILV